jgi:hypothetical protein
MSEMDWTQVLTIIGVNIALIAALATLIIWAVNKLDSDVKSMGSDMKSVANRLDGHSMRIDQLYKMFVDLLKEKK